jgi:hypothetical protein
VPPPKQPCLCRGPGGVPKDKVADAVERPLNERGLEVKLQAFRIAVTVSTLVMLVAASGAGKKWAH